MDLIEKYKSATDNFEQIEKEIQEIYPEHQDRHFFFSALSYYAKDIELKNFFAGISYGMPVRFWLEDQAGIKQLLSEEPNKKHKMNFHIKQSLETFKLYVDNIEKFDNQHILISIDDFFDFEKIKYLVQNRDAMNLLHPDLGQYLMRYAYIYNAKELIVYLKSQGVKFILKKDERYFNLFKSSYNSQNEERFKILIEFEPDGFKQIKKFLLSESKKNPGNSLNVYLD